MALSAARQPKGNRKGIPDNNNPNRTAWKTTPAFSPAAGNRTSTPPTVTTPSTTGTPTGPASAQAFPPLNASVSTPPPDNVKPADGSYVNGNGNGAPADSFRTDTEISHAPAGVRPRELQAWQAPADAMTHHPNSQSLGGGRGDDLTFGPGASTNGSWDQFAANEQMFGVTTSFDEDVYTTKLDRSGADYKERERKAQMIANEILGSTSSNPHLAEERNQADDSGVGEEDKYGAVVRSANAYVPPGARKSLASVVAGTASTPSPPPASTSAQGRPEIPKVKIETPPGTKGKPPAEGLVGTFREFMTSEKQRLEQKRQAIVKNEIDKRVADLVKFSQTFKLNRPIPEDLVPILAKDEAKQAAIREKSTLDATSTGARAIGPSTTATSSAASPQPAPAAVPGAVALGPSATTANLATVATGGVGLTTSTSAAARLPQAKDAASRKTPAKTAPTATKKPAMVIPPIPPFNPNKARTVQAKPAVSPAAVAASPASPTGGDPAFKLNVNASSFRPVGPPAVKSPATPSPAAGTPTPAATTPSVAGPSSTSSPKAKPTETTQSNPFFGTRPVKKATPVHLKDDFNPFKFAKVAEPSAVSAMWPYSGKRFMVAYPAPTPVQQQVVPPAPTPQHVPAPVPMAAPTYEEDPQQQQAQAAAAAAAARGYPIVYYPQYYPGQYGAPMHPQGPHVMQGVPGGAPPPGFIHGFIPQMAYPPPMHNGHGPPMYPPPNMGGMPPPQQYMTQPPPGAYPTPNGGPPGSIPPTPIPAHAYYHPSPQLAHAVPYGMMMAPPQPAPGAPRQQHPYENGPPQPVPMGGGAHQ